jgi:hypothetical protein
MGAKCRNHFMFIWNVQIATTEFKKVQNFLRHLYLQRQAVEQLVEELSYKTEVREFDFRRVPGLYGGW